MQGRRIAAVVCALAPPARRRRPALLPLCATLPRLQATGLLSQMNAQLQRLREQNQRAADEASTIRVQLASAADADADAPHEAAAGGPLLLEGPADQAPAEKGATGGAAAAQGAACAGDGAAAGADRLLQATREVLLEAQAAAASGGSEAAAGLAVEKQVALMSPLIQVGSTRPWGEPCCPGAGCTRTRAAAAACWGALHQRGLDLPATRPAPHGAAPPQPRRRPAEGGAAERVRPARQPARAAAQAGEGEGALRRRHALRRAACFSTWAHLPAPRPPPATPPALPPGRCGAAGQRLGLGDGARVLCLPLAARPLRQGGGLAWGAAEGPGNTRAPVLGRGKLPCEGLLPAGTGDRRRGWAGSHAPTDAGTASCAAVGAHAALARGRGSCATAAPAHGRRARRSGAPLTSASSAATRRRCAT